jgi:hypothetical protein
MTKQASWKGRKKWLALTVTGVGLLIVFGLLMSESPEDQYRLIQLGMSLPDVVNALGRQPDSQIGSHGFLKLEWHAGDRVIEVGFDRDPALYSEQITPVVISKRLREMEEGEIRYRNESRWYNKLLWWLKNKLTNI